MTARGLSLRTHLPLAPLPMPEGFSGQVASAAVNVAILRGGARLICQANDGCTPTRRQVCRRHLCTPGEEASVIASPCDSRIQVNTGGSIRERHVMHCGGQYGIGLTLLESQRTGGSTDIECVSSHFVGAGLQDL